MVGLSVCKSVCVSVATFVSPAKTAEPIEMPFGKVIWVGPNNRVFDGVRSINGFEKRTWLVISTVLLQLKNFSRSQEVTYTVSVVISRKRCTIETLLLQTTNSK